MIFTGKIQLADSTFITFFESGEVMRTVRGQNSRTTIPEVAMHLENTPHYIHASKTYQLDGKFVTFEAFKKELDQITPIQPSIDEKDYREQYTEHTPMHLDPALVKETNEEEMEINKIEVEEESTDEDVAVVVQPDQTGNWWE